MSTDAMASDLGNRPVTTPTAPTGGPGPSLADGRVDDGRPGWACARSPLGTFPECPMCGGRMAPEHAHERCTSCGWRDSCCD